MLTLRTARDLRTGLGAHLLRSREALGLRRSQVARQLGYQNLSKGSARLLSWERGQLPPERWRGRLCEALQLDEPDLLDRIVEAQAVQQRIDRLGAGVLAAETKLLAEYVELLIESVAVLQARPELGGVRSPVAAFSVLWGSSDGPVSLAELASAWAEGALTAEVDGERVFIFGGSGSALSGAGSCVAARSKGGVRRVPGSPTRHWRGARLGSPMQRSDWSLADVVAELGGTVPSTRFLAVDDRGVAGETLAEWHPQTQSFLVDEQLVWKGIPAADTTVASSHSGVRIGGGPARDVELVPGWHLGAYAGEEVKMEGWRMHQGRLIVGPSDGLPLMMDGPLPPVGVLASLACDFA